MKLSETRSLTWIIVAMLAGLSLVVHTHHLSYASYDLDEAVHIWFAQMSYADVVAQSAHDPNPPVYDLILSAWVKQFGVSEWATRFFSVLMGMLGVILMFLIASRNFGMAVGIMAALLYCFSPIQFRFTHLARPYAMLMVTMLLSYGFLLECLRRPGRWKLIGYYLATTAMIYVHPTSILNLAAQVLIILIVARFKRQRVWKPMAAMVASALSFGIWMLAIPYFERNDAMWFGPPTWDDIWYVINVFYGNANLVYLQLGLIVLIVMGWLFKRSDRGPRDLVLVLIWFLVPMLMSIGFSHSIKPIFQDKYVLSAQPALMLMLAISINRVFGKYLKWPVFLGVFALLLTSVETRLQPEGDWRSAVSYVKARHTDTSMIQVDPWYEHRTFAFYFDRHAFETPDSTIGILGSKGAFAAWYDVFDTVVQSPRSKVLHLVLVHEDHVEPGYDRDYLDAHGKLLEEKQFIGIRVLTYRFGPDSAVEKMGTD